ncbi:MAG: phosphoenolpyruvate carboxykinase (ATP), partial [Patescibacteria group bacterium]
KEHEPQIWSAIRHGSLLENVVLKKDGTPDFTDSSLTENTRVVYPIEYIENAVIDGIGPHPDNIIFLTADATGTLPPVAKLSVNQAVYHFLSGYTSKLAGTERGIKDPQATFSAFFGGPFMALKPSVYANLLKTYVEKNKTSVYLVNTGWQGGPYGIGKRISISDTRAIVTAILNGDLYKATYRRDKVFNLEVPVHVDGVEKSVLEPRKLWKDKEAYDTRARNLVGLFVENFKKFTDISKTIINAGPHL